MCQKGLQIALNRLVEKAGKCLELHHDVGLPEEAMAPSGE